MDSFPLPKFLWILLLTIAKSFTLVSVEGTEPSTTPVTVATPTIFKADPLFSVILPREGTELEIVV